MSQKPLSALAEEDIDFSATSLQNLSARPLEKEVEAQQLQAKKLWEQQNQEKVLSLKIQMLQAQSQQAYVRLEELTVQYNQKFGIYNSKIDNRSEDIYEERDKIQSNVYYVEQQNQALDEECKRKLQERIKIQQQIQTYNSKRQQLASLFMQEKAEVARMMKANKAIEDSIRVTREEYEIYQEEIFQIDVRGQNLKKYGYEIVPPKIMSLIEAKAGVQREIEELDQKKELQLKIMGRLVKLEISERVKAELARQKEKRRQLQSITLENKALREQNDKLSQIKYAYEWNPNMQIKQLEVNLLEEENRIATIQKEIFIIKRRTTEIAQKIRQYRDHFQSVEVSVEEVATAGEVETPRKTKERKQKKEKANKAERIIYEQLKHDIAIVNSSNSKRLSWRTIFGWSNSSSKTILNQFTYKINTPSQKGKVIFMSLLLLGLVCICHFSSRK